MIGLQVIVYVFWYLWIRICYTEYLRTPYLVRDLYYSFVRLHYYISFIYSLSPSSIPDNTETVKSSKKINTEVVRWIGSCKEDRITAVVELVNFILMVSD